MKRMNRDGTAQRNWNNQNDVNKNGGISRSNIKNKTGKVRWYNPDGTWRMVTKERADALYYGLDGEIHTLKGKRWKGGDYQ